MHWCQIWLEISNSLINSPPPFSSHKAVNQCGFNFANLSSLANSSKCRHSWPGWVWRCKRKRANRLAWRWRLRVVTVAYKKCYSDAHVGEAVVWCFVVLLFIVIGDSTFDDPRLVWRHMLRASWVEAVGPARIKYLDTRSGSNEHYFNYPPLSSRYYLHARLLV